MCLRRGCSSYQCSHKNWGKKSLMHGVQTDTHTGAKHSSFFVFHLMVLLHQHPDTMIANTPASWCYGACLTWHQEQESCHDEAISKVQQSAAHVSNFCLGHIIVDAVDKEVQGHRGTIEEGSPPPVVVLGLEETKALPIMMHDIVFLCYQWMGEQLDQHDHDSWVGDKWEHE